MNKIQKFKPILLAEENRELIAAALTAANGRSCAHTYDTIDALAAIVDFNETKINNLGLTAKKDKIGAQITATSGHAVANCYRGAYRNATWVRLTRKTAGWCLTGVVQVTIPRAGGGGSTLKLTAKQADKAVAHVLTKFVTIPA